MSLNAQEITQKKSWQLNINFRTYSMIIAVILIWLLFTALTHGVFLAPRNLSNLFEQTAETAILAVGMVLVIVASHIDLSVGSLAGLTGGIAAIAQVKLGMNTFESIIAALVVGAFVGLFQGWWVAFRNVPSFIVTLGGMLIWRGVLIGITNGQSIAPLNNAYVNIGQADISPVVGWIFALLVLLIYLFLMIRRRVQRKRMGLQLRSAVAETGQFIAIAVVLVAFVYVMNSYEGIPVPIFILLILSVIFTFMATKTRFGRHVYALGGNMEAARMSGIPIKKRILVVFALSGLLAGVCGIVLTARMGSGTVDAGTNFELNAIAACVIGGTSLMGGVGTVTGAVIGAIVMGTIDNGMSLMNAAPFWQYVVKGFILILAVWMDMSSKNRKARNS